LCLMYALVVAPTPFETILRTEKALLQPKFEASGTLQCSGIVLAIYTYALPFRGGFCSHVGLIGGEAAGLAVPSAVYIWPILTTKESITSQGRLYMPAGAMHYRCNSIGPVLCLQPCRIKFRAQFVRITPRPPFLA
jgi:hypothetical protein